MIINSSDDSGQTGGTSQQPSQEVSRVSVDGIASGAPADETLPDSSQPTQEGQTSPLASASETPPVSPLEPGPAQQPSEPSLSPTPEPVAPVSPQSEADETGPQADPVKEALEGTPGALGKLEENVAEQGQTFQEQGKNIGEVAAADQAAGEVPSPEQAPVVSADEVSAVTPDTNSPVSPQPVGDTLPPAAPPGAVSPAEPAVDQRPEDLLETSSTGEVTRESFQKAVKAREAEKQRRALDELEKAAEALRQLSEAIKKLINDLGPSDVETGANKGEK